MRIRKPEKVDVVIVGAGATGGTAAKVLAEAGLQVVGFDRGPWLKQDDFSGDEIKYMNRNFSGSRPAAQSAHHPRRASMRRPNCSVLAAAAVGRRRNGALGWLVAASDAFRLHAAVAARRRAGTSLADWPYQL